MKRGRESRSSAPSARPGTTICDAMTILSTTAFALGVLGIGVALACSGNSGSIGGPPLEQTGQSCTQASQCYGGIDAAAVHGQVTCLTQLQNGYCSHTCQSDADCCAVPGECLTGFAQVCASFESTGPKYCFLSCDPSAIATAPDAGSTDPSTYCQRWGEATVT